jgi:ABC-type uncharacterized transport system involved in gliding motility auxiliary subunit
MSITIKQGTYPHIKWIDLKNNGILTECAVLKQDSFGNTYYIEVPNLDGIDKQRLARIVGNRNATNFELWDLMSQITLNNGINALEYFHQLTKIITSEGVVMSPRAGTVGTKMGTVDTNQPVAPSPTNPAQTLTKNASMPPKAPTKKSYTKKATSAPSAAPAE